MGGNPLSVAPVRSAGPPSLDRVEVLLWLVPAGLATVLAMVWATWTGHRAIRDAVDDRRSSPRDDEQARAKLGAALARQVKAEGKQVVGQSVERATGVAIRRR